MKNVFSFLVLVVIISVTLISCKKDDGRDLNNTCNVLSPIENLDWLKKKITTTADDAFSYYSMATYKGETVFYYTNCDPLIDYASVVRNCSGVILGETNELYDELKNITIIWRHVDSKCDF